MKILDTVFVYRLKEGENLVWHGRYHSHGDNEYEVHFFLEGEGVFLANKTHYVIRPKTLFLSQPHEFHSILPQKVVKPITYYAILFLVDEQSDADLYQLLMNVDKKCKNSLAPEFVNRFTFEEIMQLAFSKKKSLQTSAAHLLTSHLYRWYADASQNAASNVASQVHIKKALEYMEENINTNYQIEDLAWKLDLSVEHFIRLFKQKMQMTPYQYILHLKVQKAAGMLTSTEKRMSVIAEELSFENQFHFSRVFKKCTGLSPSVYRDTYTMKN